MTPFLQPNTVLTDDEIEKYKYTVKWGTYGKGGNEPLRWVRLIDCSSEHLVNIINNLHIHSYCHNRPYFDIIKTILKNRQYEYTLLF
jgi:hypothetical protein